MLVASRQEFFTCGKSIQTLRGERFHIFSLTTDTYASTEAHYSTHSSISFHSSERNSFFHHEISNSTEKENEYDNNAVQSQQLKTSSISENYAGKKYYYSIQVENGTLKWAFTGTGGRESKKSSCNPQVSGDVIIAEFKGLAYWDIASELIFHMVEEQGFYSYDLYESAKDALAKCVSSLAKARSNCPNAYSKAKNMYNDLVNAENKGADALWEELSVLSYALGENPISVCDIY